MTLGVWRMSNTTRYRTITFFAACLLCSNVLAQQPVIPGAAGYGVNTPAGRRGEIIRVTNLNDGGQGSLRACVEASGPRYCIFEVSGWIQLESDLTVKNPNLTIAGQTAPEPGITLRGHALKIIASDVLVQHLSSRTGPEPDGSDSRLSEPLKINGPDPISNVVIDHCSLSWAIDENLSMYKHWDNVTISNTIMSEPLRESSPSHGGYGALVDTTNDSSKISFIGNLFAHGYSRNPRSNAATFVFVNNVVYNPGVVGVMLYNDYGVKSINSIVGNVFIEGPNTSGSPIRLVGPMEAGLGGTEILAGTRLYLADNVAFVGTEDPWSIVDNQSSISLGKLGLLSVPSWPDGLEALPTGNDGVLNQVLQNAGSRPAQRNTVDARVIADVRNGTGQIINCIADDGTTRCSKNVGGWPKLANNTRRLDVPENPNDDDDNDGYTNIEEWLHTMAAEVEGSEQPPLEPVPPVEPPADLAPPKAPVIEN